MEFPMGRQIPQKLPLFFILGTPSKFKYKENF